MKTFPSKAIFIATMKRDGVCGIKEFKQARAEGRYLNFPSNPNIIYDSKWSELLESKGIGNYQRTERHRLILKKKKKSFPSKEEYMAAMREGGIKHALEYSAARKAGLFQNFPGCPYKVYDTPWAELLNSTPRSRPFPTKEEFIAEAASQGIVSISQYRTARNAGLMASYPNAPNKVYHTSFCELFGKDPIVPKVFPPKEKMIELLTKVKLDSKSWKQARLAGKYLEFPANPAQVYGFRWRTYTSKYFPTKEAFILTMRREGITTQRQYVLARQTGRFSDLPGHPNKIYKCPWSDIFGNMRTKDFLTIDEAQRWVAAQNFPNIASFMSCRTRPNNIPAIPSITYREQWAERGKWLWFLGKLPERQVTPGMLTSQVGTAYQSVAN